MTFKCVVFIEIFVFYCKILKHYNKYKILSSATDLRTYIHIIIIIIVKTSIIISVIVRPCFKFSIPTVFTWMQIKLQSRHILNKIKPQTSILIVHKSCIKLCSFIIICLTVGCMWDVCRTISSQFSKKQINPPKL